VVRYVDVDTGEEILPEVVGWSDWAVDKNEDGVYVRNVSARFYGFENNKSGFRTYADSKVVSNDGTSYKLVTDHEDYLKSPLQYEKGKGYFQPVGITSPDDPWFNGKSTDMFGDKSPMAVLNKSYDELISSIGGLSCDQI
jgi:hypothetical protein